MNPDEGKLYSGLLDRLVFLRSIAEMREAVLSIAGLEPQKLRQAFEDRARLLQEERREDELELLRTAQQALREFLEHDSAVAPVRIETLEDLQQAALAVPNALCVRTLFRTHRNLLTDNTLSLLNVAATHPGLATDLRWRRMILAYVAARVMGGRERCARACLVCGSFYLRQHRFGKADQMLSRAQGLAGDGDASIRTMILAAKAGLYRASGDQVRAVEALEECLAVGVAQNDFAVVVSTRVALAECCRDLGRYGRALDELNALVPMLEQAPAIERLLSALLLRGLVQENLGRYEYGIQDYDRVRQIARETGDRSTEFVARNNLAASYLKRGRPLDAYDRYRDILRIVESWGNPQMIASTHNNLGNTLLQMERPADALQQFFRALASKINTGAYEGEAISFFGIGDAQLALGDRERAKTFYALALMPGLENRDPDIVASWASRIADEELVAEETDPISTIEWARGLAQTGNHSFSEALLTRRLIECHLRRGETEVALRLYRERLDSSPLDPRAPEQLPLITGYARLMAKQPGGTEAAFNLLNSARQTLDAGLRDVVIDERRAESIAQVIELHEALIEILTGPNPLVLRDQGNARVLAFDLHESAKSRTTLSTLADSPVRPPASVPKELTDEEAELLEAERSYQQGTGVQSEAHREQRLREIRGGLEACWNRMRQFAPDYVRFRSGEPSTFEEVRSALATTTGVRAAFVSFFCGKSGTTVFVVRPDSSEPNVFHTSTGTEEWKDIARRVRRIFNGAPAEFPPYPPILRDRPFQRSLDFLDRAAAGLLAFLPAVEDCELLCVAPHGPLHMIPTHAIRAAGGDYLARRFAIMYCPSLSIAVQLLSRLDPSDATPSVFVAGTSAAEDAHPEYFESDAAIFDPTLWRITTAFGTAASSRRKVLEALPHQDVIHLSCHGYFDEVDALDSGLLFSDGCRKPPRNPQSLSIMERRNFLIAARDLLRVRLDARLVTFNACSSGLQGQRNAGDELDGFSRALLLAGASCVMLGLWNVDQQSSGEFLRRFYRHWTAGGKPRQKWQAMHRTQLEFLDAPELFLRHPYHWAPFTLSGNWR